MFIVNTTSKDDFDYHFMREDQPRRWSHKFRGQKPKTTDLCWVTITDPRLAQINAKYNYSFVGFFILCPL